MKCSDFDVKAVIGRGHFGEVRVVTQKNTGAVFAMKVLKKSDLLEQLEVAFFQEERDIMAKSSSDWITRLHFAFQDSVNLYLVMDFHVGGDLLSLLNRHDGILDETMAQFYIAEIAIALNSLHDMGYLHRDIKPENILLDSSGHVKLADFGSAALMSADKTVCSKMPVGTPDYVAPELLISMDKGGLTYGPEVDWWSLGVCAYEMLFGSTPFTVADSTPATYANIMSFKTCLRFPSDSDVSEKAKDFIRQLITEPDKRMNWDTIKKHPFLKGICFDGIRHRSAVYVPSINGLDDTSHFEEIEVTDKRPNLELLKPCKDFSGRELPFVGFTFNQHNNPNKSSGYGPNDSFNTYEEVLAQKDGEIQKLRSMLKAYECSEEQDIRMLERLKALKAECSDIESNINAARTDELLGQITLLEEEKNRLSNLLMKREKEILSLRSKEVMNEKNKTKWQSKLEEKEAVIEELTRKLKESECLLKAYDDSEEKQASENDQNNSKWQTKLEEKEAVIEELTRKLKESERLLEAYEDSEEKQASEISRLQHKINTTLYESFDGSVSQSMAVTDVRLSHGFGEAKVEIDSPHHKSCPNKKKLTLHVTLKSGRCSFVDNKTLDRLQALQTTVDKYAEKAREWKQKEEELRSKIANLETDSEEKDSNNSAHISRKTKQSLIAQMTCYQQEVAKQKTTIQDLHNSMKTYLASNLSLSEMETNMEEKSKAEKELTKLKTEKQQVEEEKRDILKKLKEIEKEKDSAVLERKKVEEERDSALKDKQDLKREKEKMYREKREEYDKKELELREKEKEKRTLQREKRELELEKKLAVDENKRLATLNKTKEQDREGFLKDKRELTRERNELENSRHDLQQEKESVTKEKKMLNKDKDDFTTKTKDFEKEKEVFVKQKKDFEKEKEVFVKQKKDLENEKEVLLNEKKDFDKEKEAVKKERKEIQDLKTIVEKEKGDLNNEKKKMLKDNCSTEIEKEQVEKYKREKEESQKQIKSLNTQVEKLETSLSKLQDSKSSSETEVERLGSEINRLKQVVDNLETEKTQSVKRNSSEVKRNLIDRLQQENGELRRKLEDSESSERKVNKRESLVLLQQGRLGKSHSNEEKELQDKINELENLKRSLQSEKAIVVKEKEDLKRELETQQANVAELKKQLEEQLEGETELVTQLEVVAMSAQQLKKEKEELTAQLQSATKQESRASGDWKFEKLQQENKIREITQERDALQVQVNSLQQTSSNNEKIADLERELQDARIRVNAQKFDNDIPAYLRHELEESNLALSEARSLLSASKRQELELRNKVDRLQRSIDNRAVQNSAYLQNSQDAITELKTLHTQHDTLKRQYQVLEDKYNSTQNNEFNPIDKVRLNEEIKYLKISFDTEKKKVEALTVKCKGLEDKAKYLEKVEHTGAELSREVNSLKQQLESCRTLHKMELEQMSQTLREEENKVEKLSHTIREQEVKTTKTTSEIKIKEEMAELLSDNCGLRKENLKLRKHLDQAMEKIEETLGEKVSLENFTEALQSLHFLDKYKMESTMGQQMKLIDYLKELNQHQSAKKKKKLFGKNKDGASNLSLPMAELHSSLDQERSRSASLQEQVDKLKEENQKQVSQSGVISKIRKVLKIQGATKDETNNGQGKVQAKVTVKFPQPTVSALTQSPASQAANFSVARSSRTASAMSIDSISSSSSSRSGSSGYSVTTPRNKRGTEMRQRGLPYPDPMPTPQRMRHNIPHRFTTGLNTRATKCGLCLGSVHFVKQASKCQECGLVVHTKCARSVPATCGLPTEYVRHFALMMNKIYWDDQQRDTEIDQSAVKMEGWLKVPRLGKSGWENRYCVLEGTWLTLFNEDTDANPVDSFDLNPMDADVSVHSAVTSAELSNTASSDISYVLRLDQDPLTTCWPGRYLYLMTTDYHEKQRWVASLEAVVKSAQCKNDLYRNRSQMLTVISLKEEERKEFNCTLVISQQLVLVGTEDGLYAFNPQGLQSKRKQLTQLSGLGSVHQMALARGVDLIVLLTGPERRLVVLENKLVKCRMSQTLGGETTPFAFKTVEGMRDCTVFDVGLWNNASYLCVGTATKLYLMKYNTNLAMYCVRKEFPSNEPCSCVCIADSIAIVGLERFYKISLEHPSLLDFLDRHDSSLAFAAYGAANHNSFPLAVVRVSTPDLPLEFFLCFHELGVFVDNRGQRTRATDVKWSGLPLCFSYRDPFLYVTYTNTIQATVIPTDKSRAKGRQTVMDVQSPRFLGPAPLPGCAYISSSTSNHTEIMRVCGQEEASMESDKENVASKSKRIQFSSPKSHRSSPQGRLRKQTSLTSINSNSTLASSVESDV